MRKALASELLAQGAEPRGSGATYSAPAVHGYPSVSFSASPVLAPNLEDVTAGTGRDGAGLVDVTDVQSRPKVSFSGSPITAPT